MRRCAYTGTLCLTFVIVAGACDMASEDETLTDGKVQIGTGTVGWEPLLASQELPMRIEQSPCLGRGGTLIVHARVLGMRPGDPAVPGIESNPATSFSAYSEGGNRVDHERPPYRLGYQAGDAGFDELTSGHLLLLEYEEAIALDGQRLRLRVEVVDADGRFAADERWVVPRAW